MKKLLIACTTLLLFLSQAQATEKKFNTERMLYEGSDSTETVLSFTHFVEVNSQTLPTKNQAESLIEDQLQHMFGSMSANSYKGVPRGDHEIKILETAKKDATTFLVKYSFSGTVVVASESGNTYEFNLPNNPKTIYQKSLVGNRNPCTDPHYQTEGDFWYFWNPAQSGCKLQTPQDYMPVTANVVRMPNTTLTYPEYARLVDSSGIVKISLFMGMDDPNKAKDPNTSTDLNADNFKLIKNTLSKNGYTAKLATAAEIKAILQVDTTLPYIENFTKSFLQNGKKITVQIQIFFGPTGINEDSQAFHYFFKDALENSSIMMYDGHSGLGGHLDLASIESNEGFVMKPNPNRYQIYFFNSCSSYSYYNSMFFARKKTTQDPKGTKNLDILTNGLSTYFYVMHDTDMALIKAIELWASGQNSVSYQTLAQQIDSGNLFGVNGDEDNPTKPNE